MYKIIGADQKEYGPVSADQLRQWMAEGRVNGQTKVQAADSSEWKAMADIPEFAGALPKSPPPPPTVPVPMSRSSATPATSQLALWSMISGIASLLCCCGWFLIAPTAIVLGAVALSKLKSQPELTGRGMALAGIIMGCVAVLIYLAFYIFCFFNQDFLQNLQSQLPH